MGLTPDREKACWEKAAKGGVLETIVFGTMQRVGSNPTVIEIVFITHIYGIVRVIRKGSITHGLELATGRLA